MTIVPVGSLHHPNFTRNSLSSAILSILKKFGASAVITLPVQWGDQDCFQHLNNVIYLRYFESARMEHFNHIGRYLANDEFKGFVSGTKVGPIVKDLYCNFKYPVTYPDTITLAVQVPEESIKKDRFVQQFVAVSHKHSRIVAEGHCTIVVVDYQNGGKKTDIPESILKALKKIRDEDEELRKV
ncbi:hypothetical protein HK099_006339 [Clydaea vesicula]|uniref:Uncharacterized protein n=1 Tax=Clydaea vesicula TaxID=447962 RepID=A0AAD5U939_9FUNG|nr:hypothetical protein HK099_006339 [Clydaea vesicula]